MDERWASFNITAEFLDAKAAWLKERRSLSSRTLEFFVLAGKLVSLSRDDYELASLAFFQAIIGVERALRQHFLGADNLSAANDVLADQPCSANSLSASSRTSTSSTERHSSELLQSRS